MPGFVVGGRTFLGRALLVRGVELTCRGQRLYHLLDYHMDVQPEDYAGIEFLNFKEARRERKQWAKLVKKAGEELQGTMNAPVEIITNPLVTSYSKLPVCWSCKGQCSARRVCSQCKVACYCSRQCQRAHWGKHKHGCNPVEAAAE